MIVLGIESSCDECAAAVVEDGKRIISNIVASQVYIHQPYDGVVPEIASRTHTRWIVPVVKKALTEAGIECGRLDAVAVTNRPGLVGSLLVGLSFAKGYAYALGIPFIGVDHVRAHLYAPHLENTIEYPYLGLLVSGGHTIICRVDSFEEITVLGTTIDDACGEAFDKVAKHYGLGYPGGVAIDRLATEGNPETYDFPNPLLHKGEHRYDVSYSGLKTAAINQADQFYTGKLPRTDENLAASFQRAAVDILLQRVRHALDDTGMKRLVAGGGVAANSYLRAQVSSWKDVDVIFPSLGLCTDNAAMIAGIGYQHLVQGQASGLAESASARVRGFRRTYPAPA